MSDTIEISNLLQYIKTYGGTIDKNGIWSFPESAGTGYVKIIKISQHYSIMLQQYELQKSLTIKRKKNTARDDRLTFSFRNVMSVSGFTLHKSHLKLLQSVQVSTSDVTLDIEVPAHFKTSNIIISVGTDYLGELLKDGDDNLMKSFMKKEQSCLYEEIISPQIQSVAAEIFKASDSDSLVNFFYKVKSEELIFLFLSSLLRRDKIPDYSLNQYDIDAIYKLREELTNDLSIAPKLNLLAAKANMSVSKLGKIFRYIFGKSIYNYYQEIRMQQAAILPREEKLSVTAVGYQLGFSNLSHFTRLFEKHIGIKPKQYSSRV